ncbi:hypothetical protein A3742_09455 [Oleiphilus sp. HI0071]|uniref:hypothetical protein n=1 Tax=unclassified Oleiphilus TaxID=2631174 RepID=UPI0007C32886|nr:MULTISPECIES: hypothetical protein [unclassified Oleiphilus]KZY82567.1 hypothetical protein A3742_09455 [Oleiphilus sp. HI0071]KZZ50722.1 hypothetical protein A3760_13970 [Oleiphilus sp. HI0122]KZZ78780.1 hypothetical protein A3767_00930 [Oleiphilus sp. HI0133]KZZ14645.1 hypothetical protein A3750_13945 [Oleiphilus sp. HI0079]KZZ17901.1 hypothetical protein A3751_10015 [Oleiphilus sp. HI0080]
MTSLAVKSERLKAMGVQPWYARFVLNGAGRSPSFRLCESQEPSSTEEVPDDLSALNAKATVTALTTLPDIPRSSVELSSEEPENLDASVVTSASVTSSDSVHSKLSESVELPSEQSLMIFCSDSVAVVCGRCSSEQVSSLNRLTSAICSALFARNIQLDESGSFVWPTFESLALESRGADLQRKSLARFLRNQAVARSSSVLLLGADISVDTFKALSVDQGAPRLVFSSSVSPSDCLRDPAQKAFLWKELLEERRSV